MQNKQLIAWTKASYYSLAITVFLMAFPRSWSLYPLGFFLFSGLVLWALNFKKNLEDLKFHFWIISFPVLYFILHLIYLPFSPNLKFIEEKFMFLLIPIFSLPLLTSETFSIIRTTLLKIFVAGILAICLFELSRALFMSIDFIDGKFSFNPNIEFSQASQALDYASSTSRFRSVMLSFIEHPIYLSMKIVLALSITIRFVSSKELKLKIALPMALVLVIHLILLSSRIGYLLLATLIFYSLFTYLKAINRRKLIFIIAPVIVFLFALIAATNPRIKAKSVPIKQNYQNSALMFKEVDPRVTSWITSVELIAKNPLFGVGLDARNILAEKYEAEGLHNEASLKLNSHNQFLETQLTFGLSGSAILLFMLIFFFRTRLKRGDPFLNTCFLTIILASMFFESILVRQWGIMFFLLFYFILLLPDNHKTAYEANTLFNSAS